MKRTIFFAVLTLALGFNLSAQNVWEGTAVTGRYGDFPPSGYYGASNIFPRNSLVNVQNLANGKIVQIIISGALDDPFLFLVLSRQASDSLEMDRSDAANVRVSLASPAGDPIVHGAADLPYSDDPDVNPAARAGDVNAGLDKSGAAGEPASAADGDPDEADGTDTAPAAGTEIAEDSAEASSEEPPSISSRVPAAAAEDFELDESSFTELGEEKSPPPAAAGDTDIGDDWVIKDMDDARPPADAPALGVLPVPEEEGGSAAETAPEAEAGSTGPAGTETVITLEPADPKPPADSGVPSGELDSIIAAIPETPENPSASDEWARENLPLVKTLPGKSYYLQVASYKNPARVKPLVDSLAVIYPVYPVVVLDAGASDSFYHVMVGPLKEDERGLMLRQIRAKGFKDAFLKENK